MTCPNCADTGHACEEHPHRPWPAIAVIASPCCDGGIGIPCPTCSSSVPQHADRSIHDAFTPRRNTSHNREDPMSNLVEHARRELELCGQTAEDPGYAASIVATVAAFASYGHPGGSAFAAIEQVCALLRFENLSSLTDDPAEWEDRTEMSGTPLWQSRRNPAAFSDDAGRTYYFVGAGTLPGGPPPPRYETQKRAGSVANG